MPNVLSTELPVGEQVAITSNNQGPLMLEVQPAAGPGLGVESFNARTGNVTSQAGDYNTNEVDNSSLVTGATASDALNTLRNLLGALALDVAGLVTGVSSVFGRAGAVAAQGGDYTSTQITNSSAVGGVGVTGALDTLGGGLTALSGSLSALAAQVAGLDSSAIANASGVGGASVSDALDTLKAAIPPAAPVSSVFKRTGAVVATKGDYAGSLVTNDSGVVGATVSDALDTLKAGAGGAVSSVFTRTGAVVAKTGDYNSTQITNSSSVAGTGVTGALNTLAGKSSNQQFQWWTSAAPGTNADRWVVGRSPAATVQTTALLSAPYVIPVACETISLVFVCCQTALATDTVTVTLQIAPVGGTAFADSPMSMVIPAGTAAGTIIQSTTGLALAVGERIALKVRQNGATAQAGWFASFALQCR